MELLDIRDEYGDATGRVIERGAPLGEGEYILVVHVFLYDTKGRFIIQKRSDKKAAYPGKWDITGGAVSLGESSRVSAAREVQEELGLAIQSDGLCYLARLRRGIHLIDIWTCRVDFVLSDIVVQPDEVDEVKLVSADEMIRIVFGEFEDKEYEALITRFASGF